MECRPCAISSHHVKSHKQHKRIEEEEQEQENQMQANVYLVCEEEGNSDLHRGDPGGRQSLYWILLGRPTLVITSKTRNSPAANFVLLLVILQSVQSILTILKTKQNM